MICKKKKQKDELNKINKKQKDTIHRNIVQNYFDAEST